MVVTLLETGTKIARKSGSPPAGRGSRRPTVGDPSVATLGSAHGSLVSAGLRLGTTDIVSCDQGEKVGVGAGERTFWAKEILCLQSPR